MLIISNSTKLKIAWKNFFSNLQFKQLKTLKGMGKSVNCNVNFAHFCLNFVSGHGCTIMSVRFIPPEAHSKLGGTVLFASTSGDKTLRLWNAASLNCLRVIENHQRYKTYSCHQRSHFYSIV